MLSTILEYLRNPKIQRNLLIVAIIVIIIFMRGCGGGISDSEQMEYKQNLAALNDSIRVYETKNGNLVYEKKALIGDANTISQMNKELKKELKDIKDNPIFITKFKTKVIHDTLKVEVSGGSTIFNSDSSIITRPFSFDTTLKHDDNNYRTLAGKYNVNVDTSFNITSDNFTIEKDEIGMSFTTGITENKNNEVEIFIKSDYPGFVPSSIEGAIIDPTESEVIKSYFPAKRWGVSPYVGYGVYLNFNKGTVGSGVTGGIAITYDILQWSGKKR